MMSQAEILWRALEFAAERHIGQYRKGDSKAPYIHHPIAVAKLLAGEGKVEDEETLAAAILHDTLEDTDTTAAELETRFGREVRLLVEEVSDDKSLPREERMRLQLDRARSYSVTAKLIRVADKISNVRDVGANPPAGWTRRRRREYVDWAAEVVKACRGVSRSLELCFAEALRQAEKDLEEAHRLRGGTG
jgi:guanosine-3',5'-bis(diphosphate) 3'-pyrophosphohydrolase